MDQMSQLILDRKTLTDALAGCPRGAYPGTAGYAAAAKALTALSDFDCQHPEVIAELRACRSQRTIGKRDVRGL